jgi:para-aminobenzoate synthetase component 1
VNRVIDYILAGDIFEANISQCFNAKLPKDFSNFDLYLRLRKKNPAPFAAYLNLGNRFVLSASPERFMQLRGDQVETRPIKGTRPRHANAQLDQQLADELVKSEKDKAENIMIVDLLRNDLSKVCQDHTVTVTQLCGLESFATVHHLVSVVKGELMPRHDAVDLLQATFPGGSITGAPKIRAMQIIAEIEPSKRGIYCGSLGFIGFNGTMDTSIAIRTYTIQDDKISFQAGGAVVADSNPLQEYEETLIKSSALRTALIGDA